MSSLNGECCKLIGDLNNKDKPLAKLVDVLVLARMNLKEDAMEVLLNEVQPLKPSKSDMVFYRKLHRHLFQ